MFLFRLHAFGDDLHAQLVRHDDNGLAQREVLAAGLEARGERFVDLDEVDVEFLDVGQRGIARAEVVDGNLHAGLVKALQQGNHVFARIEQHAFGNFDSESFARKTDVLQMTQPVEAIC